MSFPFRFRRTSQYRRAESLPHRGCAEGVIPAVPRWGYLVPETSAAEAEHREPGLARVAQECSLVMAPSFHV